MKLGTLLGIVAIVTVMAIALWPVHEQVKLAAPPSLCLSNVKQGTLATLMYSYDHDERYPLRDAWMDVSDSYAKSVDVWRCPSVPKGAYGYAFNAALSGAKPPEAVVTTPLVYESVNPIRNASDLVTSLPTPGRHGGTERPRNTIGYADGGAKAVVRLPATGASPLH